ncbi:tripartite tricarboxylate transporter substrate-binding protein [Roseomonas xinghualingensis]|uniref:tripartite tricarboxylate transporter substrate-binding protein n=1 Tax=Roseomonas xinghualingensis TaxID=2986475 RepID=UPI0021F1A0D9|nr:tripartite tricarboxylate transporter substrate-binding protein [Roseomonas sp. SXEYE001]MCV4210271.1 tripartite tricarboxylate transporter substrate-binding protein [Roseomonas sp. SXEYE001]
MAVFDLIEEEPDRPLAVTGPRRHPLLPEVPSVGELGYTCTGSTSWDSVMALAGTPAPVIQRLSAVAREAIANPTVIRRMVEVQRG